MMNDDDLANAQAEAKVVGRLLSLVQGGATGHGNLKIDNLDVIGCTVVYHRDGKIFHLVVSDMTRFEP